MTPTPQHKQGKAVYPIKNSRGQIIGHVDEDGKVYDL